ncbi:MAG: GxxExxY protein [Phycisphaeraceae bacterium]
MRLVSGLGEEVESLARATIGAAIAVHRELGPGYLESVYESALCVELTGRAVPFVRQHAFAVSYKKQRVGDGRIDILVGGAIVVELKSAESLAPIHEAQVLSYLRATGLRLGLLMNFNVPVMKDGIRRLIL